MLEDVIVSGGVVIFSDEEDPSSSGGRFALWFGSSAVPAILSEQANEQSTASAAAFVVKNFLNSLVISVLPCLSCEWE